MKKFLTLIAVAAMAFAVQAAEWTAADGTATGEYAPVYGYNFETDQHNQMQYPAAELTGIAAGTEITAVKFYTSTPDQVNALGGTVTVSLGNIDEVTPWTPDAWGGISGNLLDAEVTAVATVAPAADENGVWTITFDVPFTYAGGDLLIDIQSVAGDYQNTAFFGKEMGSYLVMSTYGYAGSKKGQTMLPKATFTYEGGGEEPGITTLAQANALEDNAEFTFGGDAVVTVCWKGSVYLRDESGYGQIANVEATFENGQVLNQGWSATKTSVDGWVKYTDAVNLSASEETNAELAAAQKLTGVDDIILNAYVYAENVEKGFFPVRSVTLPDGTVLPLTGNGSQPATGNYNIYGVIWMVNGQLQFEPVKWEDYVEPEGLRGDVNDNTIVNIDDVTDLIDYLLGFKTETDINIKNANCDLNDAVNIDDVTTLIDYLLNGVWSD